MALLEPPEDRDERGRIVGLGAGAAEVGVVHPLAALEIDRQQRGQRLGVERHRHPLHPGPRALEDAHRLHDRLVHRAVTARHPEALVEQADAQPLHSARERGGVGRQGRGHVGLARIEAVAPSHDLERHRDVLHGAGHRPHVVDGRLEPEHAGVRDQAVGRHEPDDPAPRGGQADRAALIAAQRDVDHPAGHRRARARRRAAGDVLAVVRVERATVVPHSGEAGAAPRELLHLELAGDGGARVEQARDHGRVEVRHVAVHHVRAERHRHPGERDVILERDGLAVERAARRARHPAARDERAQRVLDGGGAAARVAVGEAKRRAPLLHPHLVEGLERGDGVHHARLDHARLRRGQVESQGAAVLHHLVDVGSPQHGFILRSG